MGLFLQNNQFESDLILQFGGLRLVAFFATSFQVIWGEKGDGKVHCCLQLRSRRRKWDLKTWMMFGGDNEQCATLENEKLSMRLDKLILEF